jgi:hypothetical protein
MLFMAVFCVLWRSSGKRKESIISPFWDEKEGSSWVLFKYLWKKGYQLGLRLFQPRFSCTIRGYRAVVVWVRVLQAEVTLLDDTN